VAADLKIHLVFSTVGVPRGRGRVERFFRTNNQLFLHRFPDYGPHGKPLTDPQLSLTEFQSAFHRFLLDEYHQRRQEELKSAPQARWEANGFLPQMPESLEKLDLLLLTVVTTRRVRRDGIYFQKMRYVDPILAAYIGADVVIRYDPRDMAEIRVYHQNCFLWHRYLPGTCRTNTLAQRDYPGAQPSPTRATTGTAHVSVSRRGIAS
jgi:putative transposase